MLQAMVTICCKSCASPLYSRSLIFRKMLMSPRGCCTCQPCSKERSRRWPYDVERVAAAPERGSCRKENARNIVIPRLYILQRSPLITHPRAIKASRFRRTGRFPCAYCAAVVGAVAVDCLDPRMGRRRRALERPVAGDLRIEAPCLTVQLSESVYARWPA